MMKSTAGITTLLFVCLVSPTLADGRQEPTAVARRVFDEIFNQHRFEAANEIYAPDFVNHGLTRDIGLKEDQEAARGWVSAFPDVRVEVEMTVAENDLVTVLWRAEGTNTGSGNGIPATGKRIVSRGITIWRVVDGRIREEWSAFDMLSIMNQLGLIPPSTN